MSDCRRRLAELLEDHRDFPVIDPPRLRQHQRTHPSLEKRDAELRLELADLPADRGLAEKQLLSRQRERQQPGRGLEALQQVERGQVAPAMHANNASMICKTIVC